jgi:hypothetical protein
MKLADAHVVSGSIRDGNQFLSAAWSDVISGGIQSHNAASRAGIVDDVGGGSFTIRQSSAILVRSSDAERVCAFLYHQK